MNARPQLEPSCVWQIHDSRKIPPVSHGGCRSAKPHLAWSLVLFLQAGRECYWSFIIDCGPERESQLTTVSLFFNLCDSEVFRTAGDVEDEDQVGVDRQDEGRSAVEHERA